jgi:hypothetical protein
MNNEEHGNIDINAKAITAIHWASGSWGQGQFDSPRYDDLTMADLWYAIAKIATKNSHKHLDSHIDKSKAVIKKTTNA